MYGKFSDYNFPLITSVIFFNLCWLFIESFSVHLWAVTNSFFSIYFNLLPVVNIFISNWIFFLSLVFKTIPIFIDTSYRPDLRSWLTRIWLSFIILRRFFAVTIQFTQMRHHVIFLTTFWTRRLMTVLLSWRSFSAWLFTHFWWLFGVV